jgi:alpha-glucuronidase
MNRLALTLYSAAFSIALLLTPAIRAETGAEAWLRYARLDANASRTYQNFPASVVVLEDTALLHSAQEELLRGISGMLTKSLRVELNLPQNAAIILGTLNAVQKIVPGLHPPPICVKTLSGSQTLAFMAFTISSSPLRTNEAFCMAYFPCSAKLPSISPSSISTNSSSPTLASAGSTRGTTSTGRIERGYAGRSTKSKYNRSQI